MKSFVPLYALTLLVLLAAPGADGQTRAGDLETSFSISLAEGLDSDFGSLVGNARFGVYLTDRVEVGGGLFVRGSLDDFTELALFETFVLYQLDPASPRSLYVRGGYLGRLEEPADGFADLGLGYKVRVCERARVYVETAYGTAISGDLDGSLLRTATGVMLTF